MLTLTRNYIAKSFASELNDCLNIVKSLNSFVKEFQTQRLASLSVKYLPKLFIHLAPIVGEQKGTSVSKIIFLHSSEQSRYLQSKTGFFSKSAFISSSLKKLDNHLLDLTPLLCVAFRAETADIISRFVQLKHVIVCGLLQALLLPKNSRKIFSCRYSHNLAIRKVLRNKCIVFVSFKSIKC